MSDGAQRSANGKTPILAGLTIVAYLGGKASVARMTTDGDYLYARATAPAPE